jgi:hypothetical protein
MAAALWRFPASSTSCISISRARSNSPCEHHGYDVYWLDPADGSITARRKWSGEHFTGEPPDRFHDWVLRLVRESTLEGMNRSYKFESREVPVQEIVIDPEKVIYRDRKAGRCAGRRPCGPLRGQASSAPAAPPAPCFGCGPPKSPRITKGYRVLGTAQQGDFALSTILAVGYPATALVRLYAINGYGTVYMVPKGYDLNQ